MGFKRLINNLYIYYYIRNDIIIRLYVNNLLIFIFKDYQQLIDDVK